MKKLLKQLIPRRIIAHDLGRRGRGLVLLTFDDGPSGDVTRGVLSLLEAHDAKALFFVIGERVKKDPELTRCITQAGHEIGNHSHTHFIDRPPQHNEYRADLALCQEAVREATGHSPVYYRPPGGHLTPAALTASRSLGLQLVRWNAGGGDWNCTAPESVAPTADRILHETTDGSIVLLHDNTRQNVHILDRILTELVGRGFNLSLGLEVLRECTGTPPR